MGTHGKLRVDLERRRIELSDGDAFDTWRIDRVKRASAAYGRGWSVVFDDATRLIARVRMTPTSTALLWWSIGALHPRAWTKIVHGDVAAALDVERSAVSKAFADLCERGILQRGPNGYRVSIWVAWQGTAGAYQKERRKRAGEMAAAREWHLERCSAFDAADGVRFWRLDDQDVTNGERPIGYSVAEWEAAERLLGRG